MDALAAIIAATTDPCTVHGCHAPEPTYCEMHHVIPRAWQDFWQPKVAPYPGAYQGQRLWDNRTVAVCRTGHGNIHYWIVKLTRAWHPGGTVEQAAMVAKHNAGAVGRLDFAVAELALARYIAAGGNIEDLAAAGLWGQI